MSATINFNLSKKDIFIMNLIIYSITFLDLGTLSEILYKKWTFEYNDENIYEYISYWLCQGEPFSVRFRISCSNIKQDLYIVSNRFITLMVSYATLCGNGMIGLCALFSLCASARAESM